MRVPHPPLSGREFTTLLMTTEQPEPRLASADDFIEILDLVDRCFNYSSGGMEESNPLSYDDSHPERHAVVERNGEIVSHIACIPETWVIDDGQLDCWGISGVATDPRYTGEGYMSDLLTFWLDRMDAADISISQLWGDRQRYGRFGWAVGGRECKYEITPRSFPNPPAHDTDIAHYDGTDEQLALIQSVHERRQYRVTRQRNDYRTVFGQRGIETIVYREPGEESYLSFANQGRTRVVKELGGTDQGIKALLSYLLRAFYTEKINCYVHPTNPLNESLGEVSADWQVLTLKKLNVRDLPAVLTAFKPQMNRRWQDTPGEDGSILTLAIDDAEVGATLEWTNDAVTITRTCSEPDIVLDRRAMTRLLFDPVESLSRGVDVPPCLRAVLPLDFYIWRTEYV